MFDENISGTNIEKHVLARNIVDIILST